MPSSSAINRPFLREPRHVVAALRLLVFAALAILGWNRPPTMPLVYWTVTVVYGLTVAGYLAAHNGSLRLRRVRIAIFLFDAAVVSALLVLRGRDVQPLLMGYFTVVLLAALLAGLGRPLWNALIGTAIYAVVMGWGRPPAELVEFGLLGPAFFFFVIAVFMGNVAEAASTRPVPLPAAVLQASTARLRATRDVLRSEERLRTVEILCAGVAHELRRPIAALLECAKDGTMLLEALANPDADSETTMRELRAVFADLGHEGARLDHVADGLGELGRGGTAQQAAVGAADMLAGAQRMLASAAQEHGAALAVEVDTEHAVLGDPARLTHVLVLLAGNALDAVHAAGGGRVLLRASDGESGSVRFEVRDDGPGMPADVRERMYDPFYTTKRPGQGTGLGLYVAREITRALGGELSCTSELGCGTTFVLDLPACQATELSEAA